VDGNVQFIDSASQAPKTVTIDSITGSLNVSGDISGSNLEASDTITIGTSNANSRLFRVYGSGDLVQITSTNDGAGGAQIDLTHESATPADGDNLGIINFGGFDSGLNPTQYANIKALASSVASEIGELHFGTRQSSFSYNGSYMILDGDGNLIINTGNLVIGTAGKGIDFSADPTGSGTSTSQLLDDYEEGTWSPVYVPSTGTFTTMTMDVSVAKYTKIGNMVTVFASIRTDNVDVTGGSGVVRISGLPFTVSNTGGGIGLGLALNFTNGPDGGTFAGSTNQIQPKKTNNSANLLIADLSNGANAGHNILEFTGTYFV